MENPSAPKVVLDTKQGMKVIAIERPGKEGLDAVRAMLGRAAKDRGP